MHKLKNIALVLLIIFYGIAGFNHFKNPESYLHIMPVYIPFAKIVNLLAGFFEIFFAILLIFKQTRKLAAWGIIVMLIAFLPVHIDMILHAPIKLGNFTITTTIAWFRLPLQGVLILWAWWCARLNVMFPSVS